MVKLKEKKLISILFIFYNKVTSKLDILLNI